MAPRGAGWWEASCRLSASAARVVGVGRLPVKITGGKSNIKRSDVYTNKLEMVKSQMMPPKTKTLNELYKDSGLIYIRYHARIEEKPNGQKK
jgi:hypothetical protein